MLMLRRPAFFCRARCGRDTGSLFQSFYESQHFAQSVQGGLELDVSAFHYSISRMLETVYLLMQTPDVSVCPRLSSFLLVQLFCDGTKRPNIFLGKLIAGNDFQHAVVDSRGAEQAVVEIEARCPLAFCAHLQVSHVLRSDQHGIYVLGAERIHAVIVPVMFCIHKAVYRTEKVIQARLQRFPQGWLGRKQLSNSP
jgi:hypothetical protein